MNKVNTCRLSTNKTLFFSKVFTLVPILINYIRVLVLLQTKKVIIQKKQARKKKNICLYQWQQTMQVLLCRHRSVRQQATRKLRGKMRIVEYFNNKALLSICSLVLFLKSHKSKRLSISTFLCLPQQLTWSLACKVCLQIKADLKRVPKCFLMRHFSVFLLLAIFSTPYHLGFERCAKTFLSFNVWEQEFRKTKKSVKKEFRMLSAVILFINSTL